MNQVQSSHTNRCSSSCLSNKEKKESVEPPFIVIVHALYTHTHTVISPLYMEFLCHGLAVKWLYGYF